MLDASDLLAGVDQIRWGRMTHAYGPAVEIPGLLRGLADADPATRETALDAMYGSVHHQGDVYACTVAAIPFLVRITADTGRPGRGEVIELLASIAAADSPGPFTGHPRKARDAVAQEYPLWLSLLDDADPQVRAAVSPLFLVCADQRSEAMAALRQRFATEPEPRVQKAIVEAVAELARRGVDAPATGGWLAELLNHANDARLRLTALAALASLPPQAGVPPLQVDIAAGLLATVYSHGTPTAPAAGFTTNTLIGSARRMAEEAGEGRRAPEAEQLVRTVSNRLHDRVDDRITLLSTLLRSPDWESRLDALYPAGHLIDGWRGSYAEIVALIGDQLVGDQPRLRSRAAQVLEHRRELARPAADALFTSLAQAERVVHHSAMANQLPWIVQWAQGLPTIGPGLRALAGCGDRRALPMLEWALNHGNLPRDAGQLIGCFGAQAEHLVPLIRQRIRDHHADERVNGLVYALERIGPAAEAGVPDLLDLPPTAAVARALGAIGPSAVPAVPMLRALAESPDYRDAIPAAAALWRIEDEPSRPLAVYERFLQGDRYAIGAAVDGLGGLGRHAQATTGRLRQVLRGKDNNGWMPVRAARALWHITGDPGPLLPVLQRVWADHPATRNTIAQVWLEMGASAAAARPLLDDELGRVRRHNVTEHGQSSGQVAEDEQLIRTCRAAIANLGP